MAIHGHARRRRQRLGTAIQLREKTTMKVMSMSPFGLTLPSRERTYRPAHSLAIPSLPPPSFMRTGIAVALATICFFGGGLSLGAAATKATAGETPATVCHCLHCPGGAACCC